MATMINMPSGMSFTRAVSYSGKALYKKCPRAWWYSYIQGIRKPDNVYTIRGKKYHSKLEDFFNNKNGYPSGEPVLRPWRPYMRGLKQHSPVAEGEVAVNIMWTPTTFNDPAAFARGLIDLWWEEPGIRHIYDWKTGKIYEDHEDQAEYYAALSPDRDLVQTTFAYLDIPTVTSTWEYTRNEVEEIRDKLDEEIMIIRMDKEWRPRPSGHCKWCAHNWRLGGECEAAP